MADQVTVPAKSAWSSTINWVSLAGPASALALFFGVPITGEQLAGILTAITTLQGVYVWVKNTWFSPSVIQNSVKQ